MQIAGFTSFQYHFKIGFDLFEPLNLVALNMNHKFKIFREYSVAWAENMRFILAKYSENQQT